MKIPPHIDRWIEKKRFPQRTLLSCSQGALGIAVDIAAQLQETTPEKIERGIHPETILFQDTGKSFKIDFSDAAKRDGQNEYENARGLIRWMYRKPSESPYRIAILENLERLSREAPHTLLKLIEEPPPHGIFLFTTRNHHQILDTILSRMTTIRIPQDMTEIKANPEAEEFLFERTLSRRFKLIENLDKKAKEDKDRSILRDFAEQLLSIARTENKHLPYLEEILLTPQAIKANQNARFCLERLAVKMKSPR